ncbi:hypothetical protein HYT25_00155 [Candidatus Pacearchaeota archaeon]|nr:hypothetical protein [Candidatus Pacearchaeota archaeon]
MPKKDEESKLEKLKKDYKKIQEKHKLPSFENLNEDFGIEKAAGEETDILIREIRRQISEKVFNYLRFVETMINPVNAPMSIFTITKSIGIEEKNKLTEIYKKLVKSEVRMISVDMEFSEKKEAEFIKEIHEIWQEIKKDFLEVIQVVEKNWENKSEGKNRKYFG